MGFPDDVVIDNASACNLRCTMCDHKNHRLHRKVETMDWDLYAKLIDEIARENPHVRVWEIFFGDPFLYKDMPARIRYAKGKGLRDVVLNTNGMLMEAERARAFVEAGLDAMYVGIDAATADTYGRIRVDGDFGRVVRNVLAYRDLLRSIGRPDQKLFVQFVVRSENEGELGEFKRFWMEEGVNIKIPPKVSWGGLVEARNLRPNASVQRKPCYWLMRTLNICADGTVALCSVDAHGQVRWCGSAREKTIRELWHGTLETYRRMRTEGRFEDLPLLCRGCADWQSAHAEFV